MCKIFRDKFNSTPEEVRYWVKGSVERKRGHTAYSLPNIYPYISDIPLNNDERFGSQYLGINTENTHFHPEVCFYPKSTVDLFHHHSHRFVYFRELPLRGWGNFKLNENESNLRKTILDANEVGILRYYDKELDDFTLNVTRLWSSSSTYRTMRWSSYLEEDNHFLTNDTFFLLYDIIAVERSFFGKDRNLCLKELYPDETFKEEE